MIPSNVLATNFNQQKGFIISHKHYEWGKINQSETHFMD